MFHVKHSMQNHFFKKKGIRKKSLWKLRTQVISCCLDARKLFGAPVLRFVHTRREPTETLPNTDSMSMFFQKSHKKNLQFFIKKHRQMFHVKRCLFNHTKHYKQHQYVAKFCQTKLWKTCLKCGNLLPTHSTYPQHTCKIHYFYKILPAHFTSFVAQHAEFLFAPLKNFPHKQNSLLHEKIQPDNKNRRIVSRETIFHRCGILWKKHLMQQFVFILFF